MSCAAAEAHADELGCWLPRAEGATWTEICENAKANGIDMQDDCISVATTCEAVARCQSESPR